MKKYVIALVVAFVLCVPAFADNDLYFANPLEFTNANGISTMSSSGDVYFCALTYSYNSSFSSVLALSTTQNASYTLVDNGVTYTQNCTTDAGNGVFFAWPISSRQGSTFDPAITRFPSNYTVAMIAEEFITFLASQPDPNPPVGLTSVLVPRGNVLYFKAASDYVFGFEAEFTKYSALIGGGNVYGPWGDTYQRLSIESSLPTTGITFPRPNSTAISWEKGSPYNVLGQSKRGLYRMSVEADGTYVAFYNPAYQSVTGSDGDGSAEVGCNVWVTGDFDFIRIYPLQQLLDTSTSPDGYENYLNGTPDGDTVIWTDPDDNVSAPVSGGDNQEDEPISSVSLIEAIKRILRNILSEIENIFTFGFSAIRDLVDLMDEFVATFDDLYEWLPEECYTLLIACVSVAIVIGVFKVFL